MTRTVAVAGGTGFLGAAIIRLLLEQGGRVRALARRPDALKHPSTERLTVVPGSLEDADALARLAEGADAVINAAGLTRARRDAEFRAVNAEGAGRAAAAAARAGASFVHISSIAARRPELSAYAESKRAGEDAIAGASGGNLWIALRAPAIYGPGDRATLPYFRLVKSGFIFAPAGDPEPRASLLYVDDVARAAVAALDRPSRPGVYDVDDEIKAGRSWREIGAALAAAMRVRARALQAPRPLLSGFAGLAASFARATGGAPMLTPGKVREFFHPDWVARDNVLSAAISWRPLIPLDEGFAKTVGWYQEKGWL